MAKRKQRQWDDERSELLDQPELLVESGRGSPGYLYVWNVDPYVECCPLCGSSVIKMQDLFTKTYMDLVIEEGQRRVINIEYNFYKFRCLNEKCRHIFAKDVAFASRFDNVTHRLEDEVARLVTEGYSYKEIADMYNGPTRQAIGQIFNRWVGQRDECRKIKTTPSCVAIVSGKTSTDPYTLILNLDDGISILDILYGVQSAEIRAVLRQLDQASVKTVVTDFDPTITDVVKDCLPNALHIIPVDCWVQSVREEYEYYVNEIIKWCGVRNKEQLIITPREQLGYKVADLEWLFSKRPLAERPYEDYQRLLKLVADDEILWIYDELVEWLESVDDGLAEELFVSEILLSLYQEELEAHMNNRELVPKGFYSLVVKLERCLQRYRTFSTEVLRARALYAHDYDLQDWRGVPIETVITFFENIHNTED